MAERLQKVMAHAGVDSRRKCEDIIRAGRVRVNGELITEPGYKIDPHQDVVSVDGREITREERVYIMLHKPPGYITTVDDPQDRPTVMDLISTAQRVYPVGRLDYDACGLLLLTNDGDLAQLLTHPRYEIEKEYLVQIRGEPDLEQLTLIETGIELEDGMTAPAKVELLTGGEVSELLLRLHEGRKRQIKRMFEALELPVLYLKRLAVGPLQLGDLPEGVSRHLKPREREQLLQLKKARKI